MSQDIATQFCAAQNVFGNGTTVVSTDWIDIGVAQDMAGGDGPVVEVRFTTQPAGGTSMEFQLTAVDAAGANPVVLDRSLAFPVASLVPGTTIVRLRMDPKQSLPSATLTALRVQTVNVGNNTAGAISAGLAPKAATQGPNMAYPVAY